MNPDQGGVSAVSADDFWQYFWTVSLLSAVAIAFVVAVTIAMLCYPGGNIHNPNQIGYSFTHNCFSDLGGYTAHSGALNFFSAFFFNGGLFLFIGVGVSFLFVPRLFRADAINFRLAWLGSILFLIGTLFFASVGLTPRDLYIDPHLFFALNAFRLMVPLHEAFREVADDNDTHTVVLTGAGRGFCSGADTSDDGGPPPNIADMTLTRIASKAMSDRKSVA